MRKILAALLVVAVIACVVGFLYQLQSSKNAVVVNLTANIPNNAVFAIECNSLKAFLEGLKDNEQLFGGFEKTGASFPVSWFSQYPKHYLDVAATLSMHKTGKAVYQPLVQLYANTLVLDSLLPTHTQKQAAKYEGATIAQISKDSLQLFAAQAGDAVFISPHEETIKQCIRWKKSRANQQQLSNDWLDLRSSRGTEELGHLYIQPTLWTDWSNTTHSFPSVWLPRSFLANLCLDIQPGLNQLRLTGIADVLASNPAIFAQQSNTTEPKYLLDVPQGVKQVHWWNITHWKGFLAAAEMHHEANNRGTAFENALNDIMESSRVVFEQKLQDAFKNEVFQWYFLDGRVQGMHLSSSDKFLRYFAPALSNKTTEGGLPFYRVSESLLHIVYPTAPSTKTPHYITFAGDFAFMGSNKNLLQKCVRAWQTKDLLNLSLQYPALGEDINLNANHIQLALGGGTPESQHGFSYFQSAQSLGVCTFSHLKQQRFYQEYLGVFAQTGAQRKSQALWTWNSSSPLAFLPTAVTNHYTGNQELVCIDTASNISLHSKSGRVLWNKKLPHRVLREPLQIDMYNNGKLQLALNTQRTLEVIDRNGNNVAPFPVHLKYQATSPVLVADYELNKDYRFLYGAGKQLLNYDIEGRPTPGWKPFEADTTISTKPWFLKIGKKDYLVILDDQGRAYVLNRRGGVRYPCMVVITDATSEIYLEKGSDISNCRFRYINANDQLVTFYFNGKKDLQNLQDIDQISQCSKVAFQNQKMWVVLSNQTLFILDENLRTQTRFSDVRFPFFSTNNSEYPIAYNSATTDSLYVIDHDHNRLITLDKKVENAQLVSFSKNAKPALVLSKGKGVSCYPFSY